MARYIYLCANDHATERHYPICERKPYIKCPHCGKRAPHVIGAQVARPSTWAKPIYSDSMGVHPSQVTEAREHSKKIGIPVDFTKDGRAIFTSRQQRRDYCRHFGERDNDGGYGDPKWPMYPL